MVKWYDGVMLMMNWWHGIIINCKFSEKTRNSIKTYSKKANNLFW